MSAASIAADVEGVGGQPVSAQTIRRTLHHTASYFSHTDQYDAVCSDHTPHTASYWSAWLKMIHKKACKQFAEDKQTKNMDYSITVLWSNETKINVFGQDGVKLVWRQRGEEYKDKCGLPTVKHGGGSIMVWGCMSAAGT